MLVSEMTIQDDLRFSPYMMWRNGRGWRWLTALVVAIEATSVFWVPLGCMSSTSKLSMGIIMVRRIKAACVDEIVSGWHCGVSWG